MHGHSRVAALEFSVAAGPCQAGSAELSPASRPPLGELWGKAHPSAEGGC